MFNQFVDIVKKEKEAHAQMMSPILGIIREETLYATIRAPNTRFLTSLEMIGICGTCVRPLEALIFAADVLSQHDGERYKADLINLLFDCSDGTDAAVRLLMCDVNGKIVMETIPYIHTDGTLKWLPSVRRSAVYENVAIVGDHSVGGLLPSSLYDAIVTPGICLTHKYYAHLRAVLKMSLDEQMRIVTASCFDVLRQNGFIVTESSDGGF